MDDKIILRFRNISKHFKKKVVLDNLNLNIYENQINFFLGKSGCGKTTLLKILVGLIKQSRGEIYFRGQKFSRKSFKSFRRQIGFVTQDNSFYEDLTVFQNLVFYSKVFSLKKVFYLSRIQELLKFTDLQNARKVTAKNLSGGQKRRLEFSIALLPHPEILILDEPFTGLDIGLKQGIWKLIERIKFQNVSIILISHELKDILKYLDKIAIFGNKRIFEQIDVKKFQENKNFDLEKYFLEISRDI